MGECLSVLLSSFVFVSLLFSVLWWLMGTSSSSSLEKGCVLKKLEFCVGMGVSLLVCFVSDESGSVRTGDFDCDLFDVLGCECDVG